MLKLIQRPEITLLNYLKTLTLKFHFLQWMIGLIQDIKRNGNTEERYKCDPDEGAHLFSLVEEKLNYFKFSLNASNRPESLV